MTPRTPEDARLRPIPGDVWQDEDGTRAEVVRVVDDRVYVVSGPYEYVWPMRAWPNDEDGGVFIPAPPSAPAPPSPPLAPSPPSAPSFGPFVASPNGYLFSSATFAGRVVARLSLFTAEDGRRLCSAEVGRDCRDFLWEEKAKAEAWALEALEKIAQDAVAEAMDITANKLANFCGRPEEP